MSEEGNDIEILDIDSYPSGKQDVFSHKQLVMGAIRKCLEIGAREMREGYWNVKTDKNGNPIKVYIPDARKEFIESVKTLSNIMSCDVDEKLLSQIKLIKEELKKSFEEFVKLEEQYHNSLHPLQYRKNLQSGIYYRKGSLNVNLPYYNDYLNVEAEVYRSILEELNNMTKRLDFYAEEVYEA